MFKNIYRKTLLQMLKIKTTGRLALLIFLTACINESDIEIRNYPSLDTDGVIDINESGATLKATFLSLGTEPIIDHGFVYSLSKDPTIGTAEKISLGKISELNTFSAIANGNLIVDREYFVRAFAQTVSRTIYGRQVSFISNGGGIPEIIKMSKFDGVIGDTIVLIGNNFSAINSENIIEVGDVPATSIYSSSDSIAFLIPTFSESGESIISLTIGQHSINIEQKFKLNSLTITKILPLEVTFGDTVEVEGINFPKSKHLVKVFGFTKRLTVFKSTTKKIEFQIPSNIDTNSSKIILEVGVQKSESAVEIILFKPKLSSFSPLEGNKDTLVEIVGDYFNSSRSKNEVFLGTMKLEVVENSKNKLLVKIPSGLTLGDYYFKLIIVGQEVQSSNKFKLI
ncbi:MAG: hypothetical protein ACJA2S_000416 [Cyclobacteriaceae bacterium]